MKKLFVFIIGTCCLQAAAQKQMTMNFVNWMRNDPTLTFAADNGDTLKYFINAAKLRDKSENRKVIEYKKTSKDTLYYSSIMQVDTFREYPPRMTLNFEGCISDLNSQAFDKEYAFNGKQLTDIGVFEVMHNDYNNFEEKKGVEKVWWSASEGILKYTTRNKKTYTRIK